LHLYVQSSLGKQASQTRHCIHRNNLVIWKDMYADLGVFFFFLALYSLLDAKLPIVRTGINFLPFTLFSIGPLTYRSTFWHIIHTVPHRIGLHWSDRRKTQTSGACTKLTEITPVRL
jgi:hypothetical protein